MSAWHKHTHTHKREREKPSAQSKIFHKFSSYLCVLKQKLRLSRKKNCVSYVHVGILTRISKTWLTSFPLISMPFISNISSPSDKSPLRSAAPPRTIRLITTLSISLRTVAPYRKQTYSQMLDEHMDCVIYNVLFRVYWTQEKMCVKYMSVFLHFFSLAKHSYCMTWLCFLWSRNYFPTALAFGFFLFYIVLTEAKTC